MVCRERFARSFGPLHIRLMVFETTGWSKAVMVEPTGRSAQTDWLDGTRGREGCLYMRDTQQRSPPIWLLPAMAERA
jgi:hypothetical protein